MKTFHNKWLFVLSWMLLIPAVKGFTQGQIDTQQKVFFRAERTFSGQLWSNGWAINYRQTYRRDAFRSWLLDADVASLRHPKEYKSQSPYQVGWGRTYVFGKLNEVYLLRTGAGYQKELFRKFDQGGISIRYFAGGGFTLAFLKPIYYYKVIGFNTATLNVITEESLFDPDFMQSIYDIYDKYSYFKGFKEMKIDPGAFIRMGLCFEYGSDDRIVRALEGGVQIEGYLFRVPIMASTPAQKLFLSLYAGFRFGRVIDTRNNL